MGNERLMVRLKTLPEALESAAVQNNGGFGYLGERGKEHFQPFRILLDQARQVAGALRDRGLAPRDVVGISVSEPDAFLSAFLGASYAGLVPAPICPPVQRGATASYIETTRPMLDASGARAILTTGPVAEIFESMIPVLPDLSVVLPVEELTGPALTEPERVTLDTPAFVQFTSGSTSDPKGVVLTHRNLAANIEAIVGPNGLAIQAHDIGVSWLPLFHDLGLIGMALATLYRGIRTQFMPPSLFLKRPAEWLRALTRHRGTVSFAPSFAYELCVRRISEREVATLDLSSWRVAGCGAEPIQASALASFAAKFEPAGFHEGSLMSCYGMAEHTLAVTFSPLGRRPRFDTIRADELAKKLAVPCSSGNPTATTIVSCGRAFPGHTLRVVDSRSRPLVDRKVGEIVLTGPSVMRGYLDGDRLHQEEFRDGWLHTGDLGYLVDGELCVCGRLKETIIVNGRNYFPQDVEWAVADLPGVRRGRVVAFGTATAGGPDRLVVVVGFGRSTPANTLAARIRRQVIEMLGVPVDEVIMVSNKAIPRTTSGKLQRARMKAAYEAGKLGAPVGCTVGKPARALERLAARGETPRGTEPHPRNAGHAQHTARRGKRRAVFD